MLLTCCVLLPSLCSKMASEVLSHCVCSPSLYVDHPHHLGNHMGPRTSSPSRHGAERGWVLLTDLRSTFVAGDLIPCRPNNKM